MSFARIEEFKALPVNEGPDNRIWVLWHSKAGAFELRVAKLASNEVSDDHPGRFVVLDAPELDPECNGGVGEEIVFHHQINRSLIAPVPDEAPAGGDGLLKAAIAALKKKYQASPLRLRPGRDIAHFRGVLEAARLLILTQSDYQKDIPHIECSWNPDLPIRARLPEQKADATHVLDEIGEWFGASSSAGYFAQDDHEWDGAPPPALLHMQEWIHDPSAHEIMAATETVVTFYREAAADFGIDDAGILRRMALLGCEPK